MVKIKGFNEKLINYLGNDKCNEEMIGEGMIMKGKRTFSKREENYMVNPGSDIKQVCNPPIRTCSNRSLYQRKSKPIFGYQHVESRLKYSFTADSLMEEEPRIAPSTVMTMVVKKNKSTKGFFSSLTKKLLPTKRNSISRKCSINSSRSIIKKKSIKEKYVNNNNNNNININISITNIPMQVIETMYTISFTKHSYYIQRSLRRSTMIVNLITTFRNNYEELREIDTPKLKRRLSFRKRVPRTVKRGEQPKEGSLVELRLQRQAKYYQVFGYNKPYTIPKKKKRMPTKPLLDFSDCESLPAIPPSAAGSKVNQYLANHNETERKKLKPIKSIDKELCLIFNKEYIPKEQMMKEEVEDEEDDDIAIGKIQLNRGGSLDNLRESINHPMNLEYSSVPLYSKHTSIDFNRLPLSPVPGFAPLTSTTKRSSMNLLSQVYCEPEEEEDYEESSSSEEEYDSEEDSEEEEEEEEESGEEEEEEEEHEQEQEQLVTVQEKEKEVEDKIKIVPSPTSDTTEVYIPIEKKERNKRISESTLYEEIMDCSFNLSDESNISDITLKEEDSQSNESSFVVIDDKLRSNIDFHFESEEEEQEEDEDNGIEADLSFLLDISGSEDHRIDNKNVHEDSFSLTKSFLLVDEKSGESIISENMSKFLLNNEKISNLSSSKDDIFNSSISILNNSIINESFTLTLDSFGDEIKNKSLIKEDLNQEKEEKPLNRIDSGIDLNCMDNINYLMERKCQI